MSFDLTDTNPEFEEELQVLQENLDGLDTNAFDSDNSTFEEEEFSANFTRTLFISRDNQPIMSHIEKFLGANNTIRQTDRTPQELSTEAKLYPKENREELKKKDAKSYQRMVEKASVKIPHLEQVFAMPVFVLGEGKCLFWVSSCSSSLEHFAKSISM